MKLLKLRKPTRTVEYFGITLEIPESHSFIAVDKSGEVYSFVNKPCADLVNWDICDDRDTGFQCLGRVDLEGMDWQDSLREV